MLTPRFAAQSKRFAVSCCWEEPAPRLNPKTCVKTVNVAPVFDRLFTGLLITSPKMLITCSQVRSLLKYYFVPPIIYPVCQVTYLILTINKPDILKLDKYYIKHRL